MTRAIECAASRMSNPLLYLLFFCFAVCPLAHSASQLAVSQAISGIGFPVAIAIDSYGNVYVGDQNNVHVRKFAPAGSGTYTPAADVSGVTSGLDALAVDLNNNLYVLQGAVYVYTPIGGAYSGQAIIPALPYGSFNNYLSLAVDGRRNVYISDYNGIYKYALDGSVYTLEQSIATANAASNIAVDTAGNIYAADNSAIHRYAVVGDGYAAPVTIASIHAYSIAVDQSDTVYALNLATSNIIRRYAPSGATYSELSPVAQGDDLLDPRAIGVDAFGSVYVTDRSRFAVEKFSRVGTDYKRQVDVASAGNIAGPVGMTFDKKGNLYVADTAQYELSGGVHKFAPSASGYLQLEDVVPGDQFMPRSIAVDSSSNVYVTETLDPNHGHRAVHKYTPSGSGYTKSGDITSDSRFSGVAVDGSDNVYVLDYDNGGVRKYSPSGVRLADVADAGVLKQPTGLTVDAAGNIFAVSADSTGNFRWTEFSPSTEGYTQHEQQILPQCCPTILIAPIDASRIIYITGDGSGVAVISSSDVGQATVMANNLWNWVYQSYEFIDLFQITGIAIDASGNLFAGTPANNSILVAHPEPHASATSLRVEYATAYRPYDNFYVNVLGVVPRGTVTVSVDNTILCNSIALVPSANGSDYADAECDFVDDTLVAKGIHTFTASYSGDADNTPSSNSVTGYYDSEIPNLATVPLSTFNLNQHGLTGSWYNPQTSGQGLEVEVYPNLTRSGEGVLAAGWYTWDATALGGQRWYTLQGTVGNTATSAKLMIYAGTGGNFAATPVVPTTPVGTATLTFDTCTDGALNYTFNDGRTGSLQLSRLDMNVTCSITGDNDNVLLSYGLSGAWYDPHIGGQGLFFDVNPMQTTFFSGWFSFVPHGMAIGGGASQHWYVIQDNAFAPSTTSQSGMGIYEPAGGTFNVPGGVISPQVGTASIRFQSCSSAVLGYAFTGGTNAGLSGSIDLQRVGPTPQGCSL